MIFVILLAANKMYVLILQLIFELLKFGSGISEEKGSSYHRGGAVEVPPAPIVAWRNDGDSLGLKRENKGGERRSYAQKIFAQIGCAVSCIFAGEK